MLGDNQEVKEAKEVTEDQEIDRIFRDEAEVGEVTRNSQHEEEVVAEDQEIDRLFGDELEVGKVTRNG